MINPVKSFLTHGPLYCLNDVNKVLSRLQFVSRFVSQRFQYVIKYLDSW